MNQELMKRIGQNIKFYRKQNTSLTQSGLAEKVGKSFSAMQKYEYGLVEIPVNILFNLSKVLDTTVWSLVGITKKDALKKIDQKENEIFDAKCSKTGETAFFVSINDTDCEEYYYNSIIQYEEQISLDKAMYMHGSLQANLFKNYGITLALTDESSGIVNLNGESCQLDETALKQLEGLISGIDALKNFMNEVPEYLEYKIKKMSGKL